MKLRTKNVIVAAAAFPIILLLMEQHAQAYWGDGKDYFSGWIGGDRLGGGGYQGAYYAGQQDAIYDHDNNLEYNPIEQCLSCHSELYWHAFHQGYDQQWNSYSTSQQQSSTQGATINIYGNNYGSASIGQSSNQGQSASSLTGLPHLIGQGLCNLGLRFTTSCQGGYGGGGYGYPSTWAGGGGSGP
jgi:hypothetical protein